MVEIPSEDDLGKLVGHRFPGGTYTIQPYEHWLLADAILAPPTLSGAAHPLFAYWVAMRGMGLTIQELFELGRAEGPDRVMFGEVDVEFVRTLRVGETYRVDGAITAVVRRHGRRAGIFDLVSFRLEVKEPGPRVAAVCTNSWVFMRGGR